MLSRHATCMKGLPKALTRAGLGCQGLCWASGKAANLQDLHAFTYNIFCLCPHVVYVSDPADPSMQWWT